MCVCVWTCLCVCVCVCVCVCLLECIGRIVETVGRVNSKEREGGG